MAEAGEIYPGLTNLRPPHAAYVFVHNTVDVFADAISDMKELRRLADKIEAAEEE